MKDIKYEGSNEFYKQLAHFLHPLRLVRCIVHFLRALRSPDHSAPSLFFFLIVQHSGWALIDLYELLLRNYPRTSNLKGLSRFLRAPDGVIDKAKTT